MTKCLQISLIAEQKQAGQGLNTFSWVICKRQSGNGAEREAWERLSGNLRTQEQCPRPRQEGEERSGDGERARKEGAGPEQGVG